MSNRDNYSQEVIDDFGVEWSRFDQSDLAEEELRALFQRYFAIFPWNRLPDGAAGADFGCGSGRWARFVAPQVGHLTCVDPSAAIEIARGNLARQENVVFEHARLDRMAIAAGSLDFGYSLGVLHHIPDTAQAMRDCAATLKPGAPFLVYLYYSFDNRPAWYRLLWRASDVLRRAVSVLPRPGKTAAANLLAATVYWPLAVLVRLGEGLGRDVEGWPLSSYRATSFYTMRTDALDRFGTRLEQRFSRAEIEAMMRDCGLTEIRFSEELPYWCAVGIKGA